MGILAMTMTSLLALLAASTAQGQGAAKRLNAYTGNPQAIEEGRALYMQHGCSGCHGVRGGGGMALPLNDDTWAFGSGDEVLFKLIKGDIPESTMPKVWNLADDQVWKMLAYIRSLYTGDPALADW
jgi:cytochrome c(L)